MPRIELIPADWETSKEMAEGDGSPTIDVCRKCAKMFTEGEPLAAEAFNDLSEMNGVHVEEDMMVGSTDVDHPPYSEEDYDCDCCADGLTDEDN